MFTWEYAMMRMPPCRYAMMRMSIGACYDANAPLVMQWMWMPTWVCNECKCPLVGISWHRMLWCKRDLFKNSFYFQNEASTTPETKIFLKLDLLFMKSHLPFDLRLPKNWWSLLEISEWGIDLESDDLVQKIYFHNLVDQKGVTRFQGLFLKKWIFWKSSILKRFIFFKFLNMAIWQASRPTVIDSRIRGKSFWNRRFKFFNFRRGRGPHKGFRCCLVVALSFFCLLRPWDFKNFLVFFALDCPFGFSP